MNHKDDCDKSNWRYSGTGYNRVRVCACGAEDHDPEPVCDWGRETTTLITETHVDPQC